MNSESDSEYFDADEGETLKSSSPEIDENLNIRDCISRLDCEGCLQAMNDCNKWILYQKIWHLKKKV